MPKEYVVGKREHDHHQPLRVRVGWRREDGGVVETAIADFEGGEDVSRVELDRRGINELIRVLRRARDQAFGRDE